MTLHPQWERKWHGDVREGIAMLSSGNGRNNKVKIMGSGDCTWNLHG